MPARFRSLSGGGTLVTLALMFLVSGGLRFWDGLGPAIAREIGTKADTAVAPAACEADPGVKAALAAIQAREARLAANEAAFLDRTRALEVAEATVAAKLDELRTAEESLLATMTRSESAAEEDLARLTAVYENMKPKEAAELFEQMDPEFAAGFLGRMRADAAAEVMAGLDPRVAYTISVLLAGRNARAPVE